MKIAGEAGWIAALALTLTLAECGRVKDELPPAADSIGVPLQKFAGSTVHIFNKGRLQLKLDAEYMAKPLTDTGSITVVPVRITMYDSTGAASTRVLSDSGTVGSGMDCYHVWGDVFIRTRDSMEIRTENLRWFKNRKRVESDTFVQIETKKGDVLRGKGLDATEDFSRFSFKSDVTGKFPDFQKRVEQENENVF